MEDVKRVSDKISSISIEVFNIGEILKAYLALLDPTTAPLGVNMDMISNGICGLIEHLERISNDLDKTYLSLNHPEE